MKEERTDPIKHTDLAYEDHMCRYKRVARHAESKKVLDIGCGCGAGVVEMGKKALLSIGMDYDSRTIMTAARRHSPSSPACRFVVADAHELPFGNRLFDIVTSFEIIEHIKEPARLLEDLPQFIPDAFERNYPVICYGGRVFSQNPELNDNTPGLFLGQTINEGIKKINQLLYEINEINT